MKTKDRKDKLSAVITSKDNAALKQIRKLQQQKERARTKLFVAEGEDLLGAADAAGWEPIKRYCAEGSGLTGQAVQPELLDAVATLSSGTRALAIYEQRFADKQADLSIYLHEVSDPGNLGTILRSAAAFGVGTVVLSPNCADPYGPKSVRASMGAVFSVALMRASFDELSGSSVALIKENGESLTVLKERVKRPLVLVVGSEREGLPEELIERCEYAATIPTQIESLNVAIATSIALYEITQETGQ